MKDINTFISESLQQRIKNHSLRTLKPENSLIDFCSNDYLGFSQSKEVKALFENELKNYFLERKKTKTFDDVDRKLYNMINNKDNLEN